MNATMRIAIVSTVFMLRLTATPALAAGDSRFVNDPTQETV
jgi:hypothetical protein